MEVQIKWPHRCIRLKPKYFPWLVHSWTLMMILWTCLNWSLYIWFIWLPLPTMLSSKYYFDLTNIEKSYWISSLWTLNSIMVFWKKKRGINFYFFLMKENNSIFITSNSSSRWNKCYSLPWDKSHFIVPHYSLKQWRFWPLT